MTNDAAPSTLAEQLAALEALVAQIAATDPSQTTAATAAEASILVHRAMERLDAQRIGWLGTVHADGWWAQESARTFAHWIAASHVLPVGAARRLGHIAATVRSTLPATGAATRAGELTSEHTRLLVTVAATSQARRLALDALFPVDGEPGAAPGPDHGDRASSPDTEAGTRSGSTHSARGEDILVDLARRSSLRDFQTIVRRFAVVSDPEADDRGYSQALEREYVDLAPTLGGYHLAGFLTQEHGQILSTALRSVTGVPAAGDTLSAGRRRALALTGLAQTLLDHGLGAVPTPGEPYPANATVPGDAADPRGAAAPHHAANPGDAADPGEATTPAETDAGDRAVLSSPGSRVRPHLSVHVSFTELAQLITGDGPVLTGPNQTICTAEELARLLSAVGSYYEDGSGPVRRAVLQRIAADCAMTRLVFGPDCQILDVGRTARTFTGPRRLAVIARDQHCVWPDCHAPPIVCQVHHATVHWADGGGTNARDGALLCWYHHSEVDAKRIAMSWADGWHFGPPGSYLSPGIGHGGADPPSSSSPDSG
ncbi:MAG: DUF222 domain-containing protein [Cellulomonadaceae bacterium]